MPFDWIPVIPSPHFPTTNMSLPGFQDNPSVELGRQAVLDVYRRAVLYQLYTEAYGLSFEEFLFECRQGMIVHVRNL